MNTYGPAQHAGVRRGHAGRWGGGGVAGGWGGRGFGQIKKASVVGYGGWCWLVAGGITGNDLSKGLRGIYRRHAEVLRR